VSIGAARSSEVNALPTMTPTATRQSAASPPSTSVGSRFLAPAGSGGWCPSSRRPEQFRLCLDGRHEPRAELRRRGGRRESVDESVDESVGSLLQPRHLGATGFTGLEMLGVALGLLG